MSPEIKKRYFESLIDEHKLASVARSYGSHQLAAAVAAPTSTPYTTWTQIMTTGVLAP